MSELVDFGNAPEIYADGIAGVHVVGVNARLQLFVWRQIDGVFRRVLVYTLIRPASTLHLTLTVNADFQPKFTPEMMVH